MEERKMTDLKSFKQYSWIITGIFALLVFISGLTANDISFLPIEYQSVAVGIIGACALLVKIIPENHRVTRAEDIVKAEYEVPKEECIEEVDEGV